MALAESPPIFGTWETRHAGAVPHPTRRPAMSAARLIRIVDAVATRMATLTLIAGLPLAAVTFAIKTF
ncbi:hypothetical protein GCM10010983_18320 [Caulobacter rhizosphaerae]|nr:hypothetical protein GCM10010983_18320 [Caulobacter rhizosphaerae]